MLDRRGLRRQTEGFNAAIVTVPDSFAAKTGIFVCQRGDLPFFENCQFPLEGNSLISETGYGTTTNVIPGFVTTKHSGNEDDNQLIIICAAVSAIVGVILLLLCITFIWFKRFRTKKHHEHSYTRRM
ncbi:uncharacterized protein LOC112568155 [Pomacea canaliculata]|uniref:uncharacterized protein LOC112568155 n=1 Tax=Pomacea canaliculata TaxID=400727 RepID=UPI000D736CA2|nr:uncharacterized protein LOC112568155 [Pomacea canaliculata]